MSLPRVTIVGRLGADPELRFTASGHAVTSLLVMCNRRTQDAASGEWKDAATAAMRVSVWREQAENSAESLRRGDEVVVLGSLQDESWTDRDGNKRYAQSVQADYVASSLRSARATLVRAERPTVVPLPSAESGDPWAANGTDDAAPF